MILSQNLTWFLNEMYINDFCLKLHFAYTIDETIV